MPSKLPTDAKARKNVPLYSGVDAYFPDALIGVAETSFKGNEQHNPGEPLHWAKHKSTDHSDCVKRHLMDFEEEDTDGALHVDKLAWRALALSQMVHEARAQGLSYAEYIAKLKADAESVKTVYHDTAGHLGVLR
jgi:hypothetical protein